MSNPQSPIPSPSPVAANLARVRHEAVAGGRRGRIYQVARVFRLDELGPLHNPEFTLVEWYQPGEGLDEGMQLTSDLCEAMLSIRHTPCADCSKNEVNHRTVGTRRVPDTLAAERISYAELFDRVVGIDPHNADGRQLAAIAKKLGVESPASLSLEDRVVRCHDLVRSLRHRIAWVIRLELFPHLINFGCSLRKTGDDQLIFLA